MLPLLSLIALAQVPIQQPPRLRTVLNNGAIVLVERMPTAKSISIDLFASSRPVPETPTTHGFRHLLEHLVAKGKGHDLDRRLETKGMFLRAFTLRDAMRFEVNTDPNQLQEGLQAISEILRPLEVTQEEIDKEIPILASEIALEDDSAHLGIGAWIGAYGDAGIDPIGTIDVMSKATPDILRQLQRKHFYPENLVVVVTGPVDLDEATKRVTELIGSRQGAVKVPDAPRPAGKPGRVETEGYGDARAALVPGFDNPRTTSALAAALAVGSEFEGGFVTYTPTAKNGLLIVGQTAANGGIGIRIDGLDESDLPRLYVVGKAMAHSWVERQLATPSGVAGFRGLLLIQGMSYKPETMLENVDTMTYDQFKEGIAMLRKDAAVTAVGTQ